MKSRIIVTKMNQNWNSMYLLTKNLIQKITLAIAVFSLSIVSLHAQTSARELSRTRAPNSVGIGAQFGQPTGLSLKVYNPNGISTDVLAAWDLDHFFFVNVHGLVENHIGSSGKVHYFVGPGVFAGIRQNNGEGVSSNDFAAGISGNFGLNVILGIVEIYGQVTPRLELIEETSGAVGGGVGIRFYF